MQLSVSRVGRIAFAALTLGGAVVGGVYGIERASLWVNRNAHRPSPPTDHMWYPCPLPAVVRPPAVPAANAALGENEDVIGVIAGCTPRAYRVATLADRQRHVINDLVGGVPVSVAYCDLTDCVRVYTDPQSREPLDAGIAGLLDGEMVVRLRGRFYIHKTGAPMQPEKDAAPLPYGTMVPARTTWGEWVRQHPATDVYVGEPATGSPAPAPQAFKP